MSDDAKCVCGHTKDMHTWSRGAVLGCFHCEELPPRKCCGCSAFRPAEEAKPASESVYERARLCIRAAGWAASGSRIVDEYGLKQLHAALDAGEAAEKELRTWILASQNQICVEPGQPGPNLEADFVRSCMVEGLSAARRGHSELIARADAAEKRAEESKPVPETVYEVAYKVLKEWWKHWTLGHGATPPDGMQLICDAFTAGEAAEKRAEAAERERDEARTEWSKLQEAYAYEINRVHDLIVERDALKARLDDLELPDDPRRSR